MDTPSLGRRIVVAGLPLVAVLALGLDVLVYVSVRSSLMAGIDRDLDHHAALVRDEVRRSEGPVLPVRLAELGVRATIREADGTRAKGQVVADPQDGLVAVRTVPLPDGRTAEITVSRAGVDDALRRLLAVEAIATPLVLVLAHLLLRLVAEIALQPLDRVAEAARRTAGGHRGERLRPTTVDTRLGQMALAYDDMLDALEDAVAKAEEAQAETELTLEHNRRIIETAREAFVAVDEAGTIVDWNAEAERTFGWRRDEILGRPVAGTIVPVENEGDGAGNGPGNFRPANGRPSPDRPLEITALHRDGHRFAARMSLWTTHHRGTTTVSAFVWDVTEQVESEEAVARLAAIVESTEAAMLSTSLEGVILTWNGGAERMYGYSASEAVGRHIDLVVVEDGGEQVERILEAVRRGVGVQRVEAPRRCKNGTLIDVALTISPVRDGAGRIYAASSIARDITEERWIAAQLDTSLAALEKALDEARASEAATRRFLDDAAHQLRAPITNIRACTEGLFTAGPDERDELLGAVVRETSRAGRLMAGLLRMARLNQGQEIVPLPCELVTVCRTEAERFAALAPHLELSVVAQGPGAIGHPRLDAHVVAEVLSNLLDNARRHAASRIDILVRRDEGWVEVEVADDGLGLPDDFTDKAFERFSSLDGKGGSGLGLPIARELARAHGGDLDYRQKAFVLRLPVSADDDGPLENEPLVEPPPSEPGHSFLERGPHRGAGDQAGAAPRHATLRDQAGTAGPDARDRTSVAAAVTAGEEDTQR